MFVRVHLAHVSLDYTVLHRTVESRKDLRSVSISRLKGRQGPNVAAVALANRNARVLWALLTKGENYRTTPFSARIPQVG